MSRSITPALIVLLAVFAVSSADGAPVASPAAPSPESTIGALTKEHNLDVGGGAIGVRITVPAEVRNVAGQTIAAVLWFYDADGNSIQPAVPAWADASNRLRLVSRDVFPTAADQRFDFGFVVPYRVFPRRACGRYAVEVRAVLVKRVGSGAALLASRSTTFFVE